MKSISKNEATVIQLRVSRRLREALIQRAEMLHLRPNEIARMVLAEALATTKPSVRNEVINDESTK